MSAEAPPDKTQRADLGDLGDLVRWCKAAGEPQTSLLRWCRTVGYARHGGVSVDMHEPCAVAGADIEYLPGVRMTIDGRPMTDAERDVIARLLAQMSHDARDALAGGSTLVVVHG